MGLSLLYLVTVKRRLCQMNQPNNYADKNICLKSPTAWGTVPLNVGFHSPRQGEFTAIWLLLQFKSQTTASHYQCSLSLLSLIEPPPPSQKLGNMTTTWNIPRFVDEIFREMFVYLKYFDEFCMKAVLTMGSL